MNSIGSAALSSIVDLLEQVPDELLTMDSVTYGKFILAKAQIKDIVEAWKANRMAGHPLQTVQWPSSLNPVTIIRDALATCPDESPTPSTSDLTFITDSDLRMNLRNDMGAINRALSNGEWKAATVLAGSVVEALLLWALHQQQPGTVAAIVQVAPQLPTKPLDEWNLADYIEAAERVPIISGNTAKQCRLGKDFRNLIHPGRVQRLGQKCDRATALSAVAAVAHVVRDLTT